MEPFTFTRHVTRSGDGYGYGDGNGFNLNQPETHVLHYGPTGLSELVGVGRKLKIEN